MTDRVSAEPSSTAIGSGIMWMLLAVSCASSMDAISKYLGQSYPVPQIVWARYVSQAVLVLVVLAPRLPVLVRTQRLGLQLVRSTMLLVATTTFVLGVQRMPLAEASAILFLAPLLVTALSLPLLREHVGLRRWVAVVVGFTGAMIVIRPGGEFFQPWALFPLAAALSYALFMIATRTLSQTDSSLTTLVYSALVGTLVTSVYVPFAWTTPDLEGWILLIGLGLLGGGNNFFMILAFRAAPAAVISPFDYSRLIWATTFGFILFGDLPDLWTMTGATLIVGSGLYVFFRRQRKTVS